MVLKSDEIRLPFVLEPRIFKLLPLFIRSTHSSFTWPRILFLPYPLIMFFRFKRYLHKTPTLSAFHILAHPKPKSQLALAASAYDHSIERITLVHVLARSADVELGVAWDLLGNCAVITGYLSGLGWSTSLAGWVFCGFSLWFIVFLSASSVFCLYW